MATPTIPNGEEYFFTTLYEGNGGGQKVGKFIPFTDNFTVANSVIFNDADNAYLSKTNDAGDRTRVTISFWVKRCTLGAIQHIFDTYDGSSTNDGYIRFNADNTISIRLGSPSNMLYTTNRTFEDTTKWYHIMLSVNTNDSTAADRAKLYVDGDRITSFSTQTNAGSADNTQFNYSSATFRIGSTTNGNYDFDGYLAEFNQVDGQALAPADFGITDTSTGRWIPVAYPTTLTTFTVTVANPGSGNKYYIDGALQATVTLQEGGVYRFDQSDSSNSGHPLRFSTTSDGSHGGGSEYTTGVTTNGTPGSTGAYTQITVASGAATLYYYCTNHSGMGGTANTPDAFGTNGFKLKFQQSNALGDDTSGNGNDFTSSGLTTTDQTTDSPTQNFATHDPNFSGTIGFSEGNLKVSGTQNLSYQTAYVGKNVNSGKWYFEVTATTVPTFFLIGLATLDGHANAKTTYVGDNAGSYGFQFYPGNNDVVFHDGSNFSYSSATSLSNGDVIGVAYDADTGEYWIAVNNTWVHSGNPSTGANPVLVATGGAGKDIYFGISSYYNVGVWDFNFGQKSFSYTPPTDFKKLQQDNMPETSKGISGFVWVKDRDATRNHNLFDSTRGKQKELRSNSSDEEFTNADTLQKFLKGGFSIEDGTSVNTSGNSFVSWNWVANGGTTETNTDGSTSVTLQKNTTAGFSIGTFKSTSASQTLGHGLGVAPEVIILKCTSTAQNWLVYHKQLDLTDAHYLQLNSTDAEQTGSDFGNTLPTSTVFTANPTGVADRDYCFWAWKSVDGFSKFGKYVGNGSTDGPFVYTGFRPAMVIVKSSSNAATGWEIRDNKRSASGGNNPITQVLYPYLTSAEATTDNCDFLSNGFKWRSTGGNRNESGYTYIYIAFAEHPFVGDGTNPVTAR